MTTSPLFKRLPVEATFRDALNRIRALRAEDMYYGPDANGIDNTAAAIAHEALAASPESPAEEVETLRKRVKELEEALAPFSLIGGPLNEVTEGVFPDDASARFLNLGELKAKHFRVADTALARAKGNG